MIRLLFVLLSIILCCCFVHISKTLYELLVIFFTSIISICMAIVFSKNIIIFADIVLLLVCLLYLLLTLIHKLEKNKNLSFDEQVENNCYIDGRTLLFVPHEDDEINMMADIFDVFNKQNDLFVVMMTTGDGIDNNGAERMNETLRGLSHYGINEDHVIFMGYGNRWETEHKHIYHSPNNEVTKSASGYTKTYALKNHTPYSKVDYTRENIINDFVSIINQYSPNIIIANDNDWHPDHKAMSLMLDEAIEKVIKENDLYNPMILKGFAYELSWESKPDFYSVNIKSTLDPQAPSNPFFVWSERIRIPVNPKRISRCMEACESYKALKEYKSQRAVNHADRVINGDRCFWNRRTDNLLLKKSIFIDVSSGESKYLNDFKIIDYEDITDRYAIPSEIGWKPDLLDKNPTIVFSFPKSEFVKKISIYECSFGKSGEYEFDILFDNHINHVKSQYGQRCDVCLDAVFSECKIVFSCNLLCISEIEILPDKQDEPLKVLKFVDETGNFIYDYKDTMLKTKKLSLYSYGCSEENLKFSIDGKDVEYDLNSGVEQGTIFVVKNDQISDSISIAKISELTFCYIKMLLKFEENGYTFEGQRRYWDQIIANILNMIFSFINR